MHIVVGVDESSAAREALRWALRTASRSTATIEAVRSWTYPSIGIEQLPPPEEMDGLAAAGLESVISALSPDGVDVRVTIRRGPAHQVLLDLIETRRPSLLVIGRRGSDERALPLALGSVSRRLVGDASCPVVVVSDDGGSEDWPPNGPRVLVGLDGSQHSERAMGWAIDFCRLTGGRIVLAHVTALVGSGLAVQLADRVNRLLAEAVATVTAQGVECSAVVEVGDARGAIMEIARRQEADLIAIGPRGVGALTKFVVGTVASYLTRYADRPVAIIPDGWERPGTGGDDLCLGSHTPRRT